MATKPEQKKLDNPSCIRDVNYRRNYTYPVRVESCYSTPPETGISSFFFDPVMPDRVPQEKRLIVFGFAEDGPAKDAKDTRQEEPYFLTHMYVPDYFDQVRYGTNHVVDDDPSGCAVPIPKAYQDPEDRADKSILGLFMLKQYITPGMPNLLQPTCKRRGQFGCPLTLHIPKNASVRPDVVGAHDHKEVLGYFTFNRMRFYPFLMIDYTVCYFICDARGAYDWNYHPNGRVKTEDEIYPLVALDAPVSYEPTLGIWMTRGAHLVPVPNEDY